MTNEEALDYVRKYAEAQNAHSIVPGWEHLLKRISFEKLEPGDQDTLAKIRIAAQTGQNILAIYKMYRRLGAR